MTRDEALKALGLSGNPSEEEIGRAHTQLTRQYHPSGHPTQPEAVRALMTEKMERVNEALAVLLGGTQSVPVPTATGAESPRSSAPPNRRLAMARPATPTGALCSNCKWDKEWSWGWVWFTVLVVAGIAALLHPCIGLCFLLLFPLKLFMRCSGGDCPGPGSYRSSHPALGCMGGFIQTLMVLLLIGIVGAIIIYALAQGH